MKLGSIEFKQNHSEQILCLVGLRNLKAAQAESRNYKNFKIVVFQSPKDPPDLAELYLYLPTDLQLRIAQICDPLAERWESLLGIPELGEGNINIASAARIDIVNADMSTRAKIFLSIQRMLEVECPKILLYDKDYEPYVRACSESISHHPARIIDKWIRGFSIGVRGLCAILYQLVYKPIRARWRDRRNAGLTGQTCRVLCVGEEALIYNLSNFMEMGDHAGDGLRIILTMDKSGQRRRLLPSSLRRKAIYIESCCSLADLLAAAFRSLRCYAKMIVFQYSFGNQQARSAISNEQRRIWDLFEDEVLKSRIVKMPGVFLMKRIANHLLSSTGACRLFLSNPSSWALDVIRQSFQAAGVISASYQHGIAESSLAYRSNTDMFFSPGLFDAKLISRFTTRSAIHAFGPFGLVHKSAIRPSEMHERNSALLLTSWTWAGGLKKRLSFMESTLQFIDGFSAAKDFERIIIKLHPFDDHRDLLAEERFIRAQYPRLSNRLVFQMDDLEGAFRQAKIVFLMPSTTVLDCLQLGLPFFVFDSEDFDRSIFVGQLPSIVMYKSSEELNSKYSLRMQNPDLNECIYTSYYGPPIEWQRGRCLLKDFLAGNEI